MTPQEIAQRGIDAVVFHSREKSADEKLEAMRALNLGSHNMLGSLERAVQVEAANGESAPIEGLE